MKVEVKMDLGEIQRACADWLNGQGVIPPPHVNAEQVWVRIVNNERVEAGVDYETDLKGRTR